jgi:hypothetical protein
MTKTDYFRPERFMCQDCGHDCREMGELYMVYHDVWEKALRHSTAQMLCVGCIEQRLGYTLNNSDFMKACPQNMDWGSHGLGKPYHQSLRLRKRLRSSHRISLQGHRRSRPIDPRGPGVHRTHDDRMMNEGVARD